jgi:hypothetical protein
MLANPEIDVFDITAPNALHKEMALQANTSIAKSRCPPWPQTPLKWPWQPSLPA